MLPVEVRTDRLGARITSLRAADREWLVPVPDRHAVTPTSSFTDEPPGGWDEMAPTIVACEVAGESYPDHGDAWREPWEELPGGALRHRSRFGYSLERRLHTDERGLRLDYRLEAERPRPVLWAAHPLFDAPPGTRVVLDTEGPVLDVDEPSRRLPWTPSLGKIDSVPERGYRKLVLDPEARVGSALVQHADGAWLELSWDVEAVPYLAVYLENRAFSTRPCVAVEPMTGWYDSLDTAVGADRVSTVSPGSGCSWSLSVRAGDDPTDRART